MGVKGNEEADEMAKKRKECKNIWETERKGRAYFSVQESVTGFKTSDLFAEDTPVFTGKEETGVISRAPHSGLLAV